MTNRISATAPSRSELDSVPSLTIITKIVLEITVWTCQEICSLDVLFGFLFKLKFEILLLNTVVETTGDHNGLAKASNLYKWHIKKNDCLLCMLKNTTTKQCIVCTARFFWVSYDLHFFLFHHSHGCLVLTCFCFQCFPNSWLLKCVICIFRLVNRTESLIDK